MIDHIAGLIFNKNKELLVVRKKNNRPECILPGGKREQDESDKETLKRELMEELGIEIKDMQYFNTYYGKPVFKEDNLFKQTAYIVIPEDMNIEAKSELKEVLWIDINYKNKGIICNEVLELQTIPDLIDKNYIKE